MKSLFNLFGETIGCLLLFGFIGLLIFLMRSCGDLLEIYGHKWKEHDYFTIDKGIFLNGEFSGVPKLLDENNYFVCDMDILWQEGGVVSDLSYMKIPSNIRNSISQKLRNKYKYKISVAAKATSMAPNPGYTEGHHLETRGGYNKTIKLIYLDSADFEAHPKVIAYMKELNNVVNKKINLCESTFTWGKRKGEAFKYIETATKLRLLRGNEKDFETINQITKDCASCGCSGYLRSDMNWNDLQ